MSKGKLVIVKVGGVFKLCIGLSEGFSPLSDTYEVGEDPKNTQSRLNTFPSYCLAKHAAKELSKHYRLIES